MGIGVGLGVLMSVAGGVAPGGRFVSGVGVGSAGSAVGATGRSPGIGSTGVGVGVASETDGFGSHPMTIIEAAPMREKNMIFMWEESHAAPLLAVWKEADS